MKYRYQKWLITKLVPYDKIKLMPKELSKRREKRLKLLKWRESMFLIIISIITGYIGLLVGSAYNLDGWLGFVGFLSPGLFLLQKTYIKLEGLEEKLD